MVDLVVMTAFADELAKIAAGNTVGGMTSSSVKSTKSVSSEPKGFKIAPSKTEVKPTNYTQPTTQAPMAAYGTTAMTSKSLPPPPVRT
jgi:hypothetical protein